MKIVVKEFHAVDPEFGTSLIPNQKTFFLDKEKDGEKPIQCGNLWVPTGVFSPTRKLPAAIEKMCEEKAKEISGKDDAKVVSLNAIEDVQGGEDVNE